MQCAAARMRQVSASSSLLWLRQLAVAAASGRAARTSSSSSSSSSSIWVVPQQLVLRSSTSLAWQPGHLAHAELSGAARAAVTLANAAPAVAAAPPAPPAASVGMVANAAAATQTAGPLGTSWDFFQVQRYRGDSLLPSGRYWWRQLGMDGSQITPLLVAANAGAFGMQCVSPTFTNMCARVGYKIAAGEYWRLITPIFVHGNLIHMMVNTFALWNLGRFMEPRLGSSTFLAVYLGSGVAGNALSYIMSPGFMVSMGSSSSLFGVFGCMAMAGLQGHLHRSELSSIGQILAINAVLMVAFGSHMDLWAHAGGFLGGAAIMAVMGRRRGGYRW